MLDAEVEYWKEIKSYLEEMKEIMNNSLLKVILYSGPTLQNITKTIDKIIGIEMDIISGGNIERPPKRFHASFHIPYLGFLGMMDRRDSMQKQKYYRSIMLSSSHY